MADTVAQTGSASRDERHAPTGDRKPPDPADEWWTTAEVATFLNRSTRAVRGALNRGTIPPPDERRPGWSHRWRPATITGWLERRRIASLQWPLQPLLDASGSTALGLAEVLGITPAALHYWASRGIPDDVADAWAVQLGLHPIEVWGWSWAQAALDSAETSDNGVRPGTPQDGRSNGEVRP